MPGKLSADQRATRMLSFPGKLSFARLSGNASFANAEFARNAQFARQTALGWATKN